MAEREEEETEYIQQVIEEKNKDRKTKKSKSNSQKTTLSNPYYSMKTSANSDCTLLEFWKYSFYYYLKKK